MEPSEIELSLSLNYQTGSSIHDDSYDYDNYIQRITGEIFGWADWPPEEPQGREINLGELRLYLIRVGNAVNDGANLFSIFDTMQETCDAAAAIYEPSFEEFSPAVERLFGDAFPSNDILLLHYLTIKPFARRQKLGLAVLHRAIRDWNSGCALVVMKPFPLQFEAAGDRAAHRKDLGLEGFPRTKKEAFSRLRKYYEPLGFQRIGRTDYYAHCPDYPMPSAEKLGLSNQILVPLSVVKEASTPRLP